MTHLRKLHSYHQPGMSSSWHSNGKAMYYDSIYETPHPRVDLQQPHQRSFDELQAERSYLLNSLQREDHKATELLKKIRDMEESLPTTTGMSSRKLKRELGRTKGRVTQCTRQEIFIIEKLGHVTLAIQRRDRWNRIENERLQNGNGRGLQPIHHLDATCPEFIPHGAYPQYQPDQPVYDSHYYRRYSKPIPTCGAAPGWHVPRIVGESNGLSESNKSYRPSEPNEPNEPNGLGELPWVMAASTVNRLRSASMPNLTETKRCWSVRELSLGRDEEAPKSDGDQYIGYYVGKSAD